MRARAAIVTSALALGACGRACAGSVDGAADGGAEAGDAAAVLESGAGLAPSRCTSSGDPTALEADAVGDVEVAAQNVYVATIRAGHASVGVSAAAGGPMTFLALGPTLGDAPPPELASFGDHVYALAWERTDAAAARTLAVSRLAPTVGRAWSFAEEETSESMGAAAAFASADVGVVAWDSSRGVRVAGVSGDHAGASRVVGGAGSAGPVVLSRKDGYALAWIEQRVDALPDGAPKTLPGEQIESPAESRAFAWVAYVRLGATGEPLGPAKKLTPESGHASGFALVPVGEADFDVFVADDTDALADDAGGRIVRIEVRGDAARAPVEVVSAGAGRGAPVVLAGASQGPWLFFDDPSGRARAVPTGGADRRASLEAALDDVRLAAPLTVASRENAWLGASEKKQLVRIRCAPASSSQTN